MIYGEDAVIPPACYLAKCLKHAESILSKCCCDNDSSSGCAAQPSIAVTKYLKRYKLKEERFALAGGLRAFSPSSVGLRVRGGGVCDDVTLRDVGPMLEKSCSPQERQEVEREGIKGFFTGGPVLHGLTSSH